MKPRKLGAGGGLVGKFMLQLGRGFEAAETSSRVLPFHLRVLLQLGRGFEAAETKNNCDEKQNAYELQLGRGFEAAETPPF